MALPTLMPSPRQRFVDNLGLPLVNGMVYTFAAGTSDQLATFQDAAGTVPHQNPIRLDERGEATIYWLGNYKVNLRSALGIQIPGYPVDNFNAVNPTDAANSGSAAIYTQLLSNIGSSIVGYLQAGAGAIKRTIQDRLRDTVSVKDFGAIGTVVPANVTVDTAAFMAAVATGKNVVMPQGTYYVSTPINLGAGQSLRGAGRGKTVIIYTGTSQGIFAGAVGTTLLIYDIEMSDFTLTCTNKVNPVDYGIRMENCVYFSLERINIYGARSPNVPEPLFGVGLYLTNNSIIGKINNVSCRQWERGMYFKTLPASPSFWTASIVVSGQGEMATNMYGIVVGDPTIAFATGAGLTIRDMCFQGNYNGAIVVNSGNTTIIDACYFEGNGDNNVTVGTTLGAFPISCKIADCHMSSENLTGSPYGDKPYTCMVNVVNGSFTTIRDNNMSITSAIPLIKIAAAAEATAVSGNRLNSLNPTTNRITNNSTSSVIQNNNPNPTTATNSFAGSFTRTLSDPSISTAYTGVGFQPSAIEFYCAVDTTPEFSIGMSDGVHSRSMTSDSAGVKSSSATAIKIIRPTSADTLTGSVTSFDPDGFTINWVKAGSPPANALTVNYIAHR